MIQASTLERTEAIQLLLNGSNLKAELVMEYHDGSDWVVIDDLDTEKGVSWSKSAKKYKYAQVSLTPLASDVSFSVLNRNAKYSEGSGTAVSGIFDLDTKVRLKAGYIIKTDAQSTTETIINTGGTIATNSIYYHTQDINGELAVDGLNFVRSESYFTDAFPTDATVQYNQNPSYTPTGFYVFTKDFQGNNYNNVNSIEITGNNTKYKIYARSVANQEASEIGQTTAASWTLLGTSTNGTQTFSLDESFRYFQFALVPDGIGSWSSSDVINNVNFTYDTYIEYLYKDIFYLDSPTFTDPPAPQMPMISCKGRDIYKRAIETDLNLDDISGLTIDTILKDLLDRVGIEYTADSIADTSAFPARTLTGGLGDTVKLDKVLEKIMLIISQDTDRYQMFLEYDESLDTNIFNLQEKPNTHVADFVFNYKHYKGIGGYSKNYDKMIKRVTIANEQLSVNELVLLDTQVIPAPGTNNFSWAGDAVYLEFKVTTDIGDGTQTFQTLAQTATSLQFEVFGTAPSLTVELYGCKISSSPTSFAEFTSMQNMIDGKGTTQKIINEMINDTAEAKKIVEELVNDFQLPVQQINNLQFPYCHLLLELNDMCMNWARFVFNDDLTYLTGFKYQWSILQDSTTFNMDDSGLNFSDISSFLYDEANGEQYDIGFVYDMGISTPLSTDAEIDAASIMTYDLEVI